MTLTNIFLDQSQIDPDFVLTLKIMKPITKVDEFTIIIGLNLKKRGIKFRVDIFLTTKCEY